jgi:hypothetical protein
MLIDVIVGSAILLSGLYLCSWASSATLRRRIEDPKYLFLQQAQDSADSDGENT